MGDYQRRKWNHKYNCLPNTAKDHTIVSVKNAANSNWASRANVIISRVDHMSCHQVFGTY